MLLDEAIECADPSKLKQKLKQENDQRFPSYKLRLVTTGKTIDDYMANIIKERWEGENFKAIVTLFKAKPENTSKYCDSIVQLISTIPEAHSLLKHDVRELLASTLSHEDCLIETEQRYLEGKEKEKKEKKVR